MPNLTVDIRLGTKQDIPFIADSWVKSIKHIYPNQYALDFTSHYHDHVAKLMNTSLTLIAHLQDEPDEIISYLVYSSFRGNQVIHFAYTKVDARNQGILKQLLIFSNPEHMPVILTSPTKNENIMAALTKHYIFDPTVLQLMGLI